ncbi:DNA mismatch repair protein MutL [Rhizoclosmatium globosum]|uniref:DNA mismatch repair protein MutL n=1 Tax=Rhizoclosmatium globosum TaxID=329046 RepID=A0A1Y2C7N4_9FUNG|nr:DNA mismatch repair protein MutL [Rhizoclosmatium globosum]|eukprot:ORY43042.1 DNA mismatch repair protein MutL [Rhizoclosmatium globosum]
MASIQPIDKSSVHRICAGQVISDLPGCVKELVENALDAKASSVEVRFSTTASNDGLDALTVIDNGSGISEENYASLCLKHYTSKISSFNDLASVSSFGFRGEALSSLCAVAGGLSVITRYQPSDADASVENTVGDDGIGVKLEYDSRGVLVSTEPAPRERGTTITIKNLFATLPVRLREFKKNFKRELNKCIDLLQAFALVSIDVRITGVTLNTKTGRNVLVSTCGNSTVKLNMSNVFGAKSLPTVMEVDFTVPVATVASLSSKLTETDHIEENERDNSQGSEDSPQVTQEEEEEDSTQDNRTINVKGLISRPIQGFGRTSNDRQFFYINNRPCDLPKLTKLVNEVYRTFNSHQYPCVVWNLVMDPDMYDVNVSPNKRTIFLHNEKVVFENIKNQLERIFNPNRAFAVSQFAAKPRFAAVQSIEEPMQVDDSVIIQSTSAPAVAVIASAAPSANDSECCSHNKRDVNHVHPDGAEESEPLKRARINDSEPSSSLAPSKLISPIPAVTPITATTSLTSKAPRARVVELMAQSQRLTGSSSSSSPQPSVTSTINSSSSNPRFAPSSSSTPTPRVIQINTKKQQQTTDQLPQVNTQRLVESIHNHNKTISTSTASIKTLFRRRATKKAHPNSRLDTAKSTGFQSGIQRDKESLAIQEFNRYIQKTDFLEMRVLGQFNLGFIVVELRGDLFIVDQHASDEKYNYEDLMVNWKFTTQRLISPMPLDLPAQTELMAIEHADVLKKNGFEIMVDESRVTGSRVHLVAIPQSTITFGVADLEDLLHKINECTTVSALEKVKCSRVLAQLASKACRKSIMIGDALDMSAMEKIVRNLSGLEHPWNCPHGRPTMRHLLDMKGGAFCK